MDFDEGEVDFSIDTAGDGTLNTSSKRARPDPDGSVRTRRPPGREAAENHLYIGSRQSLAVLFKIVRKLFDKREYSEVFLHGMGATIPKAVHLGQGQAFKKHCT